MLVGTVIYHFLSSVAIVLHHLCPVHEREACIDVHNN